jgi:TolB-like protein/DNA-binding winged helix-turn-helix (wHTH) protein/Flp pilus assembly protein TadD
LAQSAPVPTAAREYKFGVFTLDARTGDLRKHGIPIKMQVLPAQALLTLIARQGELVTRDELRRRLWANDTFVDFEHSISSAINKVRTALNDSAKHPRYIETVGRQGYRFIYPVTTVLAPTETEIAPVAVPAPAIQMDAKWVRFWVVLAALVIGVGGLAYWRIQENSHASVRSIAVLPLKNLSSDPEQEFLAEGLTDELITRLASLQGLKVISRTSSMQYKDSKKPLPQIAKELNVDAVVEGSVLRSGGRVRITAELIHAKDDHHIWAQSYERDQRDIFALQNEVTSAIAESIQLKIAPETRQQLAVTHRIDPQAHEDYLRGKHYWSKRSPEDFNRAIDYYQRAIARDPNYAEAYAGLANTYALIGGYSLVAQGPFIEKAREAAKRAVSLDPRLADAHVALAVIAQNYDWDWKRAESEYRRAIELDGNNATAHQWYGEFLSYRGRFREAFDEIGRAEQLDPLSLIIKADKGAIFLFARRYPQAIEIFKEVLAQEPLYGRAHIIQYAYVLNGQFDEALQDSEQLRRANDSRAAQAGQGFILARKGDTRAARAILRDLQAKNDAGDDPIAVLIVQVGLNDKDAAFASLERAYELHSTAISTLKENPIFDSLRNDPRFADLLKRVGLAD